MNLKLIRIFKGETYTIGRLYLDGVYFCDTLEDTVRVLNSIKDKVFGDTAIPAGTYTMILDYSKRFKRIMPHILNVPYFDGIRIHSGNKSVDTEGCILVGKNTEKGKVTSSRDTYQKLMEKLTLQEDKTYTIQII